MSTSAEIFLGIIAFSVLVMALIQVGAIVAGLRLAKRVDKISDELRQEFKELKPLIANINAMSAEAARATAVAGKQVDRLDDAIGDIAYRVEDALNAAQAFMGAPARKVLPFISGAQAAFSALKGFRETTRRRKAARPTADDEESLFIG